MLFRLVLNSIWMLSIIIPTSKSSSDLTGLVDDVSPLNQAESSSSSLFHLASLPSDQSTPLFDSVQSFEDSMSSPSDFNTSGSLFDENQNNDIALSNDSNDGLISDELSNDFFDLSAVPKCSSSESPSLVGISRRLRRRDVSQSCSNPGGNLNLPLRLPTAADVPLGGSNAASDPDEGWPTFLPQELKGIVQGNQKTPEFCPDVTSGLLPLAVCASGAFQDTEPTGPGVQIELPFLGSLATFTLKHATLGTSV